LFSSPLEYDNNIQAISNNIRQISTNIAQIKQLSSHIGTSRDSIEVREKMCSLTEVTKSLIKTTAQDFKFLDHQYSGEERTRKRTVQQKLMKEFQLWGQKFQEVNKFSVDKEKSNPPPNRNQKNSPVVLANEQPDDETQHLEESRSRQLQLHNEITFNGTLIQARDADIRQIEKNIIEVNEIFQDLSKLVVEQGSMIDNIESNIESSVVSTSTGVEEIRKASDHQKKARTKLCCLTVILLIIASVLVLVIFLFFAK